MINRRKEVDLSKVEIIVLEGCGVRWHAYDSALEELATVKDWQQIKKIAASSGGGMPAFLAAIGNTPKQIQNITTELNFEELLDPIFLSKIPYIGHLCAFLLYHGFVQGNKARHFAEKHLQAQGLSAQLTFEELAKLKESTRPDLKYLYLAAAVVTRGSQLIIFSHETTPHVRIADAMVAVIAYPGSGIPVKLLIEHKIEHLFDGGVRDNFIINYFSKDKDKILGLKIDTYQEIFGFPHEYPSTGQFFYSLIQDNHHDFVQDSHRYSLQLYDGGISILSVPLTRLQNFALHVSGKLCMANLIQNHRAPHIDELEEKRHDDATTRLISMRTNVYIRHLQEKTLSLKKIADDIGEWQKTHSEPFLYYTAILYELQAHAGVICNDFDFKNLSRLLKISGEDFAEKPEALASDVTDILLAFLNDAEIARAAVFLKKLYDNHDISAKLLDVEHTIVLKKLKTCWSYKAKVAYRQLQDLLENLHEQRLALFPGAYQAHKIIILNDLIVARQFDQALEMLAGTELACLRTDLRLGLYEVTQKQIAGVAAAEKLLCFLENKTGKFRPRIEPSISYASTFLGFFAKPKEGADSTLTPLLAGLSGMRSGVM